MPLPAALETASADRHLVAADFAVVRTAQDMPDAYAMVREFWRYTQSCRVSGGPPARRLFDPTAIAPLMARVWILDVLREPFDLRYRLAGTHIVETVGFEPTGRLFSDILADRIAVNPALIARYRYMVETGLATWRRGPARHWQKMKYKSVENLCVPFAADDGRQATQIVSISVCYLADGTVF